MARFLGLTWPPRVATAEEEVRGMWLPWLLLVVAVLLGIWLLPGAWSWLPTKLTPQKLWLATWPLLVGGGLAALGAWGRRWWSGDPSRWLPAGDIGVLLEKLVAGARSRTSAFPAPFRGSQGAESLEAEASTDRLRLASVVAHLGAIERRLGSWSVSGFALLVSMGLLLWLLTGAGG
jgi:hypothetical protein